LNKIDLSLAGNLLLIVIFSGYENFVSKMDFNDHKNQPEWHGSVGFSTLKLKLIASIVAISGIHLLKIFMDIHKNSDSQIKWMLIIHISFVISGVLLTLMDRIAAGTKVMKKNNTYCLDRNYIIFLSLNYVRKKVLFLNFRRQEVSCIFIPN
jgi:uncharacterized protein (TIGR00645 family)